MHPQIQTLADKFHSATARMHALARAVPAEKWPVRRDPERWSVAECVAHLNLTGEAYAALFPEVIARALALGPARAGIRYRRDFWSWILGQTIGPKVRFRMKTPAKFVSRSVAPVETLVTEFLRWQGVQLGALTALDGLRLNEVNIVSPFNPNVNYNIYGCLAFLPSHQHRHLGQAKQIWAHTST
ncbi:MAG: DinB family protein [Gemmatimonadota bacterium]